MVNPGVLLITTHGGYVDVDTEKRHVSTVRDTFESPIRVHKFNAAPLGVCNYISIKTMNEIANTLISLMEAGKMSDMSDTTDIWTEAILKDINKELLEKGLPNAKMADPHKTDFNRHRDSAYKLSKIDIEDNVLNKRYIAIPEERTKDDTLYSNSITLLNDRPHNDILQEIKGKSYRKKEQELTLSELLHHLKLKGIEELYIIDLACSATDVEIDRGNPDLNDVTIELSTDRENRATKRSGIKLGGNNRKTKRNKKKTTKRKRKRKNTIRNKKIN